MFGFEFVGLVLVISFTDLVCCYVVGLSFCALGLCVACVVFRFVWVLGFGLFWVWFCVVGWLVGVGGISVSSGALVWFWYCSRFVGLLVCWFWVVV